MHGNSARFGRDWPRLAVFPRYSALRKELDAAIARSERSEYHVLRCGDASRHHAVQNASFDVDKGEVLGLMGKSGCGKTSVALALLGLLSKDRAQVSGSIQFHGRELLTMDQRALCAVRGAGISMVFQDPEIALNPVMRVRDQVAEAIRAHREVSWNRCLTAAELALVRVGLPNTQRIFSAYPHQLSGGHGSAWYLGRRGV